MPGVSRMPWSSTSSKKNCATAVAVILRGGPRYGSPDCSSEGGYAPLGFPRPTLGRAPAEPWRASGLAQDASFAAALHHEVSLALLHHLAALVHHGALDRDQAAVGLGGLLLRDHLRAQADRVADLDRPLELPAQPDEGEGGVGLCGAREETGLDGEPEQAVGDALAKDRLLHELGVGVEHVVVAGQPGEEHDVRLGHRAARRLVLLAHGDVVEEAARVGHVVLLYRAHGESRDKPVEEEVVDDGDGDAGC